ncbi:MAG TPA: LysM peptidoglycan-binding domain-containing protein [Chloroflexi bacterium]|nr:LysM peptidoglycan-binding domain-containing protein [Chloroflexota bacterium]
MEGSHHSLTLPRQGYTVIVVAILCLSLGIGGPILVGRMYSQHYAHRIYPGVSVYGVDLGGLTVAEAAAALQSEMPGANALPLTLRDGERIWSRSWADVALRLDPKATAFLAYRVGRQGSLVQQRGAQLYALLRGWPLSPVAILPTAEQAALALQALAPQVFIPPINATLTIEASGVITVPGRPGRELDIETIVALLPHTIGVHSEGVVMELLTRPVPPAIEDPGPARAQAQALLAHPFTLTADDPLTDFYASWSVEPQAVAEWLTTRVVEEEESARLLLTVRTEAVQAYLEDWGSQLTDRVGIDIAGTVPAVQAAIEAGQRGTSVALVHYPHSYTVQPGDTLMSVAYAHGFPIWRLTEVNPTVDPGRLQPGQQILIPSIDVLFPLPLVTRQRIVVSLSDQRLIAYEDGIPVFDFVCSTGLDSSPTLPGQFQILSKKEEAYASSWDLWMPHFMGIYRTGPDFTNGIHALPTLSNGTRLWEGILGRPVSYGCIVLGLNEAAMLYDWAELGALITIQE